MTTSGCVTHNNKKKVALAMLKKIVVLLGSYAMVGVAYSNPDLNQVTSGNVNVTQSGNTPKFSSPLNKLSLSGTPLI